jgi:uncharacterized membrane protein
VKRVERSIIIPASADEVFGFASSLDDLPRWQSGVVSTEMTSSGPMLVGSTALVIRELMGQRIEAPLEVTGYDPPRMLQLHSEVSGVKADAILEVEPEGTDASRVTFAMEIRGSGFTSFIESMIASAAESDIDASLERLKDVIAQERSPAQD